MKTEHRERLIFAHLLADTAGKIIRPYFRAGLDVTNKATAGKFDPVTEADRGAERALRALIEKTYPDDAILGEEYGAREGTTPYRWLLDPIDGTRAFITGQPLWGTLIALEDEGRAVIGMIDQPVLNERFIGAGGVAHLQTPEGTTALKTRACAGLGEAILSSTHPWDYFLEDEGPCFNRLARAVRMSRFGGDCYGYGLLAAGFVDIVAEAQLKAWDIAPLIPIIEGAGGVVTDWAGAPVQNGGRVLACGDARVHAEAVKMLNT